MASDLHAPLGLQTTHRRWWQRIPFGLIGATLIGATVTVAVIWASFLPDPSGGDTIAVVRVDRSKTGIGLKDIGVAGSEAAAPPRDSHGAAAEPPAGHGDDAARRAAPTPPVPPSKRPGLPADGQTLTSVAVARITDAAGKYGPLPKVAPDGARPLEVYARPPARRPGTTPRVVVVVGGLGLSQTGTQEALRLLPPDVTLAFSPYGTGLDRWVARARQDGHELLLQIPMEPFDFPDNDPGPQTLMSNLSGDDNIDRLRWALARISTYVGVVNYAGGKLTSAEETMAPVMREITARGLMFLDDGSSSRSLAAGAARAAKTPFTRADVVIDSTTTEAEIDARLAQLEGLARQKGLAVGTATALPVSLRRISEWAKGLESRGILVVPASAAVREGQG